MILFFGPAGAGKSVQGQMLANKMGWEWISSGQLLRASTDPEIVSILQAGNLVPLEKFGQLFAEAIKQNSDKSHVILDGFPRKVEQAQWLVDHKPELERELRLAIVIDIPREELVKRMTLRGRADDTEEAIEKRHAIYQSEIDPILAYLNDQQVPIIHIDGVGEVEQIHERVVTAIKEHRLG